METIVCKKDFIPAFSISHLEKLNTKKETIFSVCESCNSKTNHQEQEFTNKPIDIKYYFNKALKKMNTTIYPDLIKGVIIDKNIVHPDMPKTIKNPKIVLLSCPLEVEKPEFSSQIQIKDPAYMKDFINEEVKMLKRIVDKIKSSGANVVLSRKGIDDHAHQYLVKKGIMAVRRIKESEIEKISKARRFTK